MAESLPPSKSNASTPPTIEWVPFGVLTIYPVTEHELDLLERGTPESTYFGFAIFLLSAGISFLIALLTADIQPQRLFNVFLVVALVGIIGGLLLLIVWVRYQRSTTRITRIIRNRKALQNDNQRG